jgi:hypothetical protein
MDSKKKDLCPDGYSPEMLRNNKSIKNYKAYKNCIAVVAVQDIKLFKRKGDKSGKIIKKNRKDGRQNN